MASRDIVRRLTCSITTEMRKETQPVTRVAPEAPKHCKIQTHLIWTTTMVATKQVQAQRRAAVRDEEIFIDKSPPASNTRARRLGTAKEAALPAKYTQSRARRTHIPQSIKTTCNKKRRNKRRRLNNATTPDVCDVPRRESNESKMMSTKQCQ